MPAILPGQTDIYALTDSRLSLGRPLAVVAGALLDAGVRILQYREKKFKAGKMLEECRLLRRLTRDYRQRGADALSTLSRWASVRRGEEKHIFPYQENADIMLNSSLFYEISVLRPFAEKILREVPDTVPEYDEAQRMLKFLDNFMPIPPDEIPPTSILREFIGGSSFQY